jgi:hypothetical protein
MKLIDQDLEKCMEGRVEDIFISSLKNNNIEKN